MRGRKNQDYFPHFIKDIQPKKISDLPKGKDHKLSPTSFIKTLGPEF